MHRRPDWVTERVALVLTFTSPGTWVQSAWSGRAWDGPPQRQLGMQSRRGSAKPTRRRLRRRSLRLKVAALGGRVGSRRVLTPRKKGREGSAGAPEQTSGGGPGRRQNSAAGWSQCPAIRQATALGSPGDLVKQGNSKLIACASGRHAIRLSDLSTRW